MTRNFVPTTLLALALAPFLMTHSSPAQAADVENDCAAINASFVPVTGRVTALSPTSARPAKGAAFRDPAFNSCVVRATDHVADGIGATFVRNDYSRRQAFNADNSLFITYSYNGAWQLYDARTLVRVKTLSGPAGDAEPQWDPINPRSLYYVPTNGGTKLMKLNVDTNTSTVAADFAGRLPWADATRIWSKSEGSPSADGRYWCFMAETAAFGIRGVFTYDLQAQAVVGTRAMSNRPDHVSMTPSGRSCVVSDGDVSGGIMAWDRNFTTSRKLHTVGEHSDIAIGANGDDYFVFVDYSGSGELVMVDVDTGVRTPLLPTYIEGTATAYHVSGKSFSKPGWILLSTYANYGGPEKWLHARVMAVELKANPKIINLAHHHSQYNEYWTEPHATVNRDFTRVLFNSNWGTTSTLDVDAFMIRLPNNLIDGGVAAPPLSCTRGTPTMTMTGPTGPLAAGTSANYAINVRNNDSAGCASTSFPVARSVPAGWSGTLSATSVTLGPGLASTITLAVASPTTAAAGSYGIGSGVSSSVGTVHTANASAVYNVAAAAQSCTRAAPTVTMTTPTASFAAGSTASYTVSVRNNDSAVCSATAFSVARSVPSGWTGTLASASLSPAPGATASTSLQVVSTTTATAGTYGVGSGVSSSIGAAHTGSSSSTYVVSTVAPAPAPAPATGQVQTAGTDKGVYLRGQTVQMVSRVLLNGQPAIGSTVYFTVFPPNRAASIVTSAKTDSTGNARSSLVLSSRAAKGTWGLYVSASTANAGSSASTSFQVK